MVANTPRIIGICGQPGHGKSTAQCFLTNLGVEARDDAHALRQRCVDEYGLTWEQVTTQEGKLEIVNGIDGHPMTVRQLLGDYGQIYERECGPNYWIDIAIEQLREERIEHPVSFGSIRRTQGVAVRNAGGFMLEIWDPRKSESHHGFDQYDRRLVDHSVINKDTLTGLEFRVVYGVARYLGLARPIVDEAREKFLASIGERA